MTPDLRALDEARTALGNVTRAEVAALAVPLMEQHGCSFAAACMRLSLRQSRGTLAFDRLPAPERREPKSG